MAGSAPRGVGTFVGTIVNRLSIERVLACPSLPSLPSVAAQVIELTRGDNVSAIQIAKIVQHDPALSGKVLKTVNSSYYGLATPCPSLGRAVTLLGLNTVKSIVLGFSLVDGARSIKGGAGLDPKAHWRRAIYTAAASRSLAQACGKCEAEEAFLGALMQDLGALAIYCTDAAVAEQVNAACGGDHAKQAEAERDILGFDHGAVGGALAERWRLPAQLGDAIAQHHNASPSGPHADLVRAVHVAGLVAEVCAPDHKGGGIGEIERLGREWLGLDREMVRSVVERVGRDAQELARSLDLDTGAPPDTSAILAAAHAELTRCNERMQIEATQLKRRETELTKASITDGLTAAFNRAHFETELQALTTAIEQGDGAEFSVIFVDADHFKRINDRMGHAAGDIVLREISRRLQKAVGRSGQVFRYGGEEFVVLLRRIGSMQAARIAELLRRSIESDAVDVSTTVGSPLMCPVTVSVGVASGAGTGADPKGVVAAADAAVYRAKRAGRNRACVDGDDVAEAEPEGRTVLIIEDDALASKLMAVLFGRRRELRTLFATTGDEAMAMMRDTTQAIDLVVCDLNLPGLSGIDLVRAITSARRPTPPVVVVSATSDNATRDAAMAAGAADFIPKGEFSNAIDKTLDRIVARSAHTNAAA